MERYYIVTSTKVVNEFKKSKHFKQMLGQATTMIDKSGKRETNQGDEFAYFFYQKYKTPIYSAGKVGDIHFYSDYYITDDTIYMYWNKEEFKFKYDWNKVKENSIEHYLGFLIKTVESKDEEMDTFNKEWEDKNKNGDPSKLKMNPGAVTYADIQKYMEQKNKERFL